MKKEPDKMPVLTLPWLIIAISSMVMFMAFLISMFYEFHTAVFFAIWMWIIAASLFVDGVSKRKRNKLKGNITLIMGVLAVIAGVFVVAL
ncbi:MAG: hypothetical protein IJZ57_00110 [Clostridia bacterium]|nr:hypothetical protein [Clostridia bacterium]